MKTLLFKTILILNIIFIFGCKAQTGNDYVTFYNGISPKLNTIVPYKTQFYGQPFSNFYNELLNKNIHTMTIGIHNKIANSPKMYVLALNFCESDMAKVAIDYQYQYPKVWITFENEIPSQIKNLILQYQGEWNTTFAQFFSNMKIEKIEFTGINGYNNPDRSPK